jgi:hypothetical protein
MPTSFRWVLEDLTKGDSYQFHHNPNAGGSGVPEKTLQIEVTYSVESNGVLQQAPWGEFAINFSGSILTRAQDELMEAWALRQTTLRLTDDLGRVMDGVLTSFTRTRTRRAFNPWFSNYDAEFKVLRQVSASGVETWNEVGS